MPTFVAFAPLQPETHRRPLYWAGAFAVSLAMWAVMLAAFVWIIP